MSYAALVLPEQEHIPSEVLKKIRALVADGATVIGHQRPTGAPGLQNREKETQQVERLVNELWGGTELSDKSGRASVAGPVHWPWPVHHCQGSHAGAPGNWRWPGF